MTCRIASFCTALWLIASSGIAQGSDFPPLADFRVADPTGRYYVVWKRLGGPKHFGEWGPTEFTIAERGPGTPPVEPAQSDVANLAGQGGRFFRMLEHPDVVVRPGDVVCGQGQFERPPRVVIVSSTGLGFVALDVYGPNMPAIADGRGGHAVVVFSLDGELLVARSLRDLFADDQIGRFRSLGDVISWLRGAWINEVRHELVVASGGDELRVLNLVSGQVRAGAEADVVRGLDSKDPEAVKQALIIATDRGFQSAREAACRILADPGTDRRLVSADDVRLRAAVALAVLGDRRGADLIRHTAGGESLRELDTEAWDRKFQRAIALEYLPEAVGSPALPLLLTALANGKAEGSAAFTALVKLGASAVETVAPLVAPGQERRLRLAAIGILGSIGPSARSAAEDLKAALSDEDPLVRIKAALALARIDPEREGVAAALRAGLSAELNQPWAQPIREACAESLVRLGADGIAALGNAMDTDDASVRRTMIATLARLGPEAGATADVLVGALDDEDRTVREWALEGLIRFGDGASNALVAGLGSESAPVRSGSAFVLGKLQPSAPTTISALRSALKDDDPLVRSTAAGALGRIDPQGAEPVGTLIELLEHDQQEVRAKAAYRLGTFGPRAAVGPLVGRLKDLDRVAAAAARALGEIGPEASPAIPQLIAALEHGGRLLRRDAAVALGQFGPAANRAVPALIERLEDDDWHVPHLAATALGQIGASTPAVVSALAAAVRSGPGDSDLRLAAIDALAQLRPESGTPVDVLVQALGDPCRPVAQQAVESVAALGEAAVDPLLKAFNDPSRDLRLNAAAALGRIGPDAARAAPALIEALADADPAVGFYCEQPLVQIGPAAMPALIEALSDRRSAIRRVAARILGRFRAEAQPGALAAALDDANPYVRSQAAYSLGNIGPPARSAAAALGSASGDESPLVRRAAAWALDRVNK